MNHKEKLLTTYKKMYIDNNVTNNYLYFYILLTKPLGYMFWLYFYFFNLINIPYIYELIICNSLFENVMYVIFSCITADFISGLVHIYLDNSKVNYSETIIDYFKIGFQVHHLYPIFQWVYYKDFQPHYEANTIFFINIVMSIVNILTYNSLLIHYTLYLTLVMQMNHYWCHAIITKKHVPYIVHKLQDFGLLLNYKVHAKHHITFDNSFCFVNGICDPIFNYISKHKYLLDTYVSCIDTILY
uniref:Lipid desaturase domain-containing protein n=1 Tax=viral metagenome TaxID=1070528 RepID=A0A6C0IMK7_9ZZZZ